MMRRELTRFAGSVYSELVANKVIGDINANVTSDGIFVEIGGKFPFAQVAYVVLTVQS